MFMLYTPFGVANCRARNAPYRRDARAGSDGGNFEAWITLSGSYLMR
jgi:hypothetical protein